MFFAISNVLESFDMTTISDAHCRVVQAHGTYDGKQGLTYFNGIAKETVGSKGICMHLLTIPPARAPRRICTRTTRRRSTS